MSIDLFEQLGNEHIPPPPPELDRQVHHRINRALVFGHLVDLGLQGMCYALGHFALAVLHLLILTFSGRMPPLKRPKPADRDADDRID